MFTLCVNETLTLHFRFCVGELLGMENFIVTIVSYLQYKSSIHNTVTGLESAVTHTPVMEILHALTNPN